MEKGINHDKAVRKHVRNMKDRYELKSGHERVSRERDEKSAKTVTQQNVFNDKNKAKITTPSLTTPELTSGTTTNSFVTNLP